jgi:putative nucleotidyltransferase with HDIG domain
MSGEVDAQKIQDTAAGKNPLEFRFGFLGRADTQELNRTLDYLLAALDRENLAEELRYILLEFVTNANKSNLKRVYFHSRQLDIHDPEQYRQGMEDFADQFHAHLAEFGASFDQFGLFTRVRIEVKDRDLFIIVRNSNAAVPEELARVRQLVAKSKLIHDAAEAFMSMLDNTEGAGLGTISSMLMLRNLGLTDANYHFYPDFEANETEVSVRIPLDTVTEKEASAISGVIAREIERLPAFPENVNRVEKLLEDPDVSFEKVAQVVQSDPSLTAEILRIVNSSQYMLPQRVGNITNALSLIGLKGLRGVLYSFGTQRIVAKHYGRMDKLWEHSYRTASYAYNFCREFKLNQLCDDAYVGGILHDIGKVVIYHLHPGLLEKINAHTSDKPVEDELLERLAIGVSHERIGAEISRKWNFPDAIISVIGFHHQPFLAPDENRDLVTVVYLANQLTRVATGEYTHSQTEPAILERFGIVGESDTLALAKKLSALYEKQKLKA